VPTAGLTASDHYIVISADSHGGGSMEMYREYLDPEFRDDFDAWRGDYANPFRDLQGGNRTRNWDGERRITEQQGDGVVGEVVYPNTVPPFFPTGALLARPPHGEQEFRQRLAGIRAHNRWLADWCAEAPERRAGVAQVFLNDMDEAVKDVIWAKEHGLRGGILVPGVPDDAKWIEPLYSPTYDKLWAACQDYDVVVNQHSGGGSPDYGDYPAAGLLFLTETVFFSKRGLSHLLLGGVFERFPKLRYVMAEQGCSWVPELMDRLDAYHAQMQAIGRVGELGFPAEDILPLKPSEYIARNCWFAASFPGKAEAASRHKIGVDRVVWASDYPHHEGTYPFTVESLRWAFADVPPAETARILGANAAELYGFDLDALAPYADADGPTVAEVAVPLDGRPEGATSPCFSR